MAPYKLQGGRRLFLPWPDIYKDRRCCQMQENIADPHGVMYGERVEQSKADQQWREGKEQQHHLSEQTNSFGLFYHRYINSWRVLVNRCS